MYDKCDEIIPQVFRNGRRFDYKGQRDLAGIVQYMKEQAKLPSREVQTSHEALNNFARTDANVIGYFAERNDMFDEYIGAANELRGKVLNWKLRKFFLFITEYTIQT